jgi:WD40 repeat protein
MFEGGLVDGHPMLLDRAGRTCVDLWPMVQLVPPTEGAEPELFLFDSHGGQGALLIATPSGLEHHDETARDWVATHVIAEIEAKTRMRDQIRVAARQWQDRARPDALLWRGEVLADLERWTRHMAGAEVLGDLEAAFVAASRRTGRRVRWGRRLLGASVVATLLGFIVNYFATQQRMAERIAEQAEVEQGRQALLHDDLGEAQQHLAEAYRRGDHSPTVAFMLARALQPRLAEQARFAAAAGRMWSAAFSPDGKAVVTAGDQAAQVWDAQTNQLLFTLPHGDTVYDARYSGDGARIVTGSGDGAVRIWAATTGALVREIGRATSRRYYATALSPDSKFIAAINRTDAVAYVWDSASGALLAGIHNDASGVPALAFSADGRWLATSGGNDVRVFDVSTWSQTLVLAGPHIHTLSFDPTGPRLVTGSAGGDVSIWEIPSGTRTRHLREIGDPVNAIAFSPDGQLIAAGGGDGAVQIWRATTGALQTRFNAMPGKILTIEFDPASKLVVAGGDQGAVVVADAVQGMPETMLDGTRGVVMTAHFDPTSRRVVGASWDGTARIWDTTSPYRRWRSPPVADDCGLVASLEPDSRFLAIGCRDHATRVWDTARDQLLAELPSATPVPDAFSSAFPAVDADGDRAAIARGNTVEIYELPGGRLLRTIRHGASVSTVAFGPAGHDLVSGAIDGSLLVTRDHVEPIALSAASGGVDAAAILPDGRVVVADAHRRLRLYDATHNALLVDLETTTRVRMLRSSVDGIHLITIPRYDGRAAPPLLWDLDHDRLIAQLEGHTGRVFSARFTTRGIVTVGGDGAVRLWRAETGRLLETYRSTSRFLADAVIDPDRAMIIASGSDGLVWFWDLPTRRLLWKLQAHRSHAIGLHFEGNALVTRGFAGDVSRWVLPSPERIIEATQASLAPVGG